MLDWKGQSALFAGSIRSLFFIHAIFIRACLVTAVLAAAMMGIVWMSHYMAWMSDSTYDANRFEPYAAIFPGQASEALTNYHCAIMENRVNGELVPGRSTCAIFPENSIFHLIHVESWHDQIKEVVFYATDLQLGELILDLKRYEMRETPTQRLRITWNAGVYTVTTTIDQLRYQDAVRMVTLTIAPEL